MTLRQRIGYWILLLHIQDFYWEPSESDPHVGTGYFKIDYNWYRFVKWLSGCKPEELIKKGAKNLNEIQ